MTWELGLIVLLILIIGGLGFFFWKGRKEVVSLREDNERWQETAVTTLEDFEALIEEHKNKPYREVMLEAVCENCHTNQLINLTPELKYRCGACNRLNSILIDLKSFAVTEPVTTGSGFDEQV